jgi:hypothetical protein
MDNPNTLATLGKLYTERRQTNKWKIKAKHNKQIKNQNETQYRKQDEQIESDQTPRVTPSEWQAVPTSYKTTAMLII